MIIEDFQDFLFNSDFILKVQIKHKQNEQSQ